MSSIVINPKSSEELKFISELLKKLGVKSKVLSDEDSEDLGLALLMREADRTETVSEEEIMSKLNG
ncbi:hypothetical protein BXY85_3244 [Roseivirga pacifica]|uniref:Uncharacterized protein n=1 Tax=Roseivirga pacifica TaxID=1267423 RepID=A0A1I0QRL4_9BACT|nr:hypothetical protein [Roseivirga pacifica]RKQ42633.1 hypothetical protein BXY85_3244 [Roseivirga pacifica]SEW30226.1 hypothetical protein SAMN05216290_2631 [Roseivirga pacifica]